MQNSLYVMSTTYPSCVHNNLKRSTNVPFELIYTINAIQAPRMVVTSFFSFQNGQTLNMYQANKTNKEKMLKNNDHMSFSPMLF